MSAYVRENSQIVHSLDSDGLKLHSGECSHTKHNQMNGYTQQIRYSAVGRGMTDLKGEWTVPHRNGGLKFNPAVKLERLGSMSQQFYMPRSL